METRPGAERVAECEVQNLMFDVVRINFTDGTHEMILTVSDGFEFSHRLCRDDAAELARVLQHFADHATLPTTPPDAERGQG